MIAPGMNSECLDFAILVRKNRIYTVDYCCFNFKLHADQKTRNIICLTFKAASKISLDTLDSLFIVYFTDVVPLRNRQ